MAASDWQYIPTDTMRKERRKAEADTWAKQERSRLAADWAEQQRRWLAQQKPPEPEPTPQPEEPDNDATQQALNMAGLTDEVMQKPAKPFTGPPEFATETGDLGERFLNRLDPRWQLGQMGQAAGMVDYYGRQNLFGRLANLQAGAPEGQGADDEALKELYAQAGPEGEAAYKQRFQTENPAIRSIYEKQGPQAAWQYAMRNDPGADLMLSVAFDPLNIAPIGGAIKAAQKVGPVGEALLRGAKGLAPEVPRVARELALGERGGAELGATLGKATEAPSKRYYHGTGSAFETPEAGKFDPNGLYGPGYYLTDNPEVAGSYAKERGVWTHDSLQETLADEQRALQNALARGDTRRAEIARKDIAILEAKLASPAGPNIRPIDVPEGLKLLDAEKDVPADTVNRVLASARAKGEGARRLQTEIRMAEGGPYQSHVSGQMLWDALSQDLRDNTEVNQSLLSAGYDGIRYQGGKRIPMKDAAGNPIEHEAVVIFPESLPKITNALSKTQGGQVGVGPAIDLGGGAVGAGSQYDPNATPEENAARMAAGGAVGFGLARAARTGRLGLSIEDITKGKPAAEDVARLRPFAEDAVPKWAPEATAEDVMEGVWQRLLGKPAAPAVRFAADETAKAFLEAEAQRLLPSATEGIQSQVRPGHILVYRTARDPREGLSILSAAEQGQGAAGFQPSTHHVRDHVKRAAETAEKKGRVPVYTSNYPSVAGFYQTWNADMPIMFALEVPEDAVIYKSSRAAGTTQGRAYGLVYPDTEIIIDAKRISRLWHVPTETVQNVVAWAKELDEALTAGTGFRNAFRDKDPKLAEAGAAAIADLRKPPASLGRPFVEAPVEIPAGLIKRGDRVVLATGDTAVATEYREISAEHRQYNPASYKANLRLSGYKGPTITGLLDPYNMPDKMIVRVLKPGERISKTELAAIAEKERGRFLATLRAAKVENERYLSMSVGDEFRQQRLRERGQQIDDMLRKFGGESGRVAIGPAIDLGSSAAGAATGYATADENATPEERLARAALGAAGGFGASRALRTGRMGLGVEDVSKKALTPLEQAKLRLQQAKGTPEQAAQLRPEEAGFAGNINLAKGKPENVPLTEAVMDDPAYQQMAGQRRGVISDAEALENAKQTATQRTIEDWLAIKPGTALNEEQALALRSTTEKTGNEYRQLQTEMLQARTAGTLSPAQEAKVAEKALEFAALTAVRSGAAAEAGRALRSFRLVLEGDYGSQERAIQKAFEILGGGDSFEKWVDKFSQLDPADQVGRTKLLKQLFEPTIWEKINAWRYASMLSSYKTHMVNSVSNASESLIRPIETALAGYPKEAAADVYGTLRGVPEGLSAALDMLKTGVSRFETSKLETGNLRPRALGDSPFMRAVALPSDLLVAADDFWKTVNYSGSIHAEAYRLARGNVAKAEDLLQNPTQAMVENARKAARYATYQNDPHELVSRIINVANTPGSAGTLVRIIMPFIRTPANIYARGLGMLIAPLAGPVKVAMKAAKGDARAARLEAAKTVIAGTTLAGLWGLAASGNLTGQGPSDPAKRRILEESGWQSNSVKIGDRWLKYSNLGPVSIPMAAVAAVKEGLDEGKKPNHELLADVADRVYNSMLDVSFVQGLSDVLRGEGFVGRAAQIGASTLGTAVPYGSGLAAVERIADPTMRARDNPLSAVQGRIPIVSQALPAEPSIYGATRQQGAGDTLGQIVFPWTSSTEREDPVAKEVARLNQSDEARKAGAAVSVRQFGDTYAGAKQAPEQRRLLQGEAGKLAATYIADMISRPAYQKLTDVQKVTTLNKALGTAYELADLKLGEQLERDDRHKALLSWASIPQYEGVKGTPEEVRLKNYEIAQAKAKRTEYRKQYGDPDLGDYRLLKEDKQAYQLAQRARLDSEYLQLKKKRVDEKFGGALSQAEKEGLLGAGNSLVPVGGK